MQLLQAVTHMIHLTNSLWVIAQNHTLWLTIYELILDSNSTWIHCTCRLPLQVILYMIYLIVLISQYMTYIYDLTTQKHLIVVLFWVYETIG